VAKLVSNVNKLGQGLDRFLNVERGYVITVIIMATTTLTKGTLVPRLIRIYGEAEVLEYPNEIVVKWRRDNNIVPIDGNDTLDASEIGGGPRKSIEEETLQLEREAITHRREHLVPVLLTIYIGDTTPNRVEDGEPVHG